MDKGFTIIDDVYTPQQVDHIIKTIQRANTDNPTFRITNDLFAIRQF